MMTMLDRNLWRIVLAVACLLTSSLIALAQTLTPADVADEEVMVNPMLPLLFVYAEPSEGADLVEALSGGVILILTGEAETIADVTWWEIETPSEALGWVVEVQDDVSTLLRDDGTPLSLIGAPVDSAQPTRTPSSAPSEGDDETVSDETVVVAVDLLFVYAEPSIDSDIIEAVALDVPLIILAPSETADDGVWWQVQLPSGSQGWIQDVTDGLPSFISATIAGGELVRGVEAGVAGSGVVLLIYSEPDPESEILEAAVSGVVLRIIDGPELINDVRWWQVRSISGIAGWTPEMVDGDAVLVPLSEMVTPTAAPTAPPITATSTPQNLPNILRVGGQAQVYVEDEGLKLRSSPDVSSSILENLPVGTIVTLLSGPVSGGAYRWWQARSPAGNEGWLVESADGITTLIPIAAVPTANTSGLDGQFALSAEVQIVSLEPAFPLRASPSMRAGTVVNLARSERATIIGGPQAVSESEGGVPQDFTWWQIRAAGGTEGWIQGAYYDEPVLISYNPANPIQPVICTLSTFRDVNIRSGPGTGYEQIASRDGAAQILAADGQYGDISTPEAHWWRLYNGFWIRDDQVSEQTRESCAALPIVPAP